MSSNRPEEGRLHRLARAKPNIPVTTWRKEHGRAGGNMQTIERERERGEAESGRSRSKHLEGREREVQVSIHTC